MGETDKDKEQEATKSLKSAESGGKKSSMSVSVRSQGVNGNKTPQITSRQSGRVSFYGDKAIADKDDRAVSMAVANRNGQGGQSSNPFKLPSDADIFMLRDKERKRKKEERERQKHLRVHEKVSKPLTTNFRKVALGIDETLEADDDNSLAVKDDPQFVLQVTRDRNIEKETLNEYVNKKREMFLVQYSLGVKRDEMRKLEEIAGAEEKKLELAEQYLEEDATMFDEFLKDNDKNSVDAIKTAELETKAKMEKVIEIKRLNAQMMSVKSEISKCEETLKEYLLYKKFLDSLSPKEWFEEREAERLARAEEKQRVRLADRRDVATPSSGTADVPRMKSKSGANLGSRSNTMATGGGGAVRNPSRAEAQVDDDDPDWCENIDDNPQLYFKSPQQLLDIFSELEEQNLSLIQNSQETEEALEEMKQTMRSTSNKMEKETAILKEQINKLQSAISREEEKAKDLKLKAQMFNFGEFKSEDQDSLIDELNKKVEEVYRACVGDNKANINTLQMLTNIENRLEELFEQIERLPPDRVELAKKEKERERRLKMREEKMEQQRIHQEERVKKALERAQAEAIKKTGRRLVGRSQPPKMTQRIDKNAELISKEEEELAYYFNP